MNTPTLANSTESPEETAERLRLFGAEDVRDVKRMDRFSHVMEGIGRPALALAAPFPRTTAGVGADASQPDPTRGGIMKIDTNRMAVRISAFLERTLAPFRLTYIPSWVDLDDIRLAHAAGLE